MAVAMRGEKAPTDDETLDTDNAVNVLEEPTESQRHYYILDLKLKRLVHVRNIICATHPHPQCHLLQIFKEFMTQVEPRATLRGIILSYKTPPINLPKLAKKCVSRCHHEHKLSPATVIAPTVPPEEPVVNDSDGIVSLPYGEHQAGCEYGHQDSAISFDGTQSIIFPLSPPHKTSNRDVRGGSVQCSTSTVSDRTSFENTQTVDVRDKLVEVGFSAAYWRELGQRLTYIESRPDLEAIDANNRTVEERFDRVIDFWRRHGDNPCWETLAEAVAKCTRGGNIMKRDLLIKVEIVPPDKPMVTDSDGGQSLPLDPSPVTYEDEIKEPTSDDETLISAQNSNKDGSSVDPIPIRDEVEVGEPDVLQLTSQSEQAPEEMQVIAKRESMVASVLTTVAKLVLPKYMIDPILLMCAVSLGDKAEVENLISRGANPNASPPMDSYLVIIIHCCVMQMQFTPLMEASRLGNVEIAQLLLEKGADPNLTNNEGCTALMAAANSGRLGTTDVLLRNRANPNMQSDVGCSALMAAVSKRHDDVALRIIEAGATPHIQDQNHTNALLLATATNEQGTVVDALLDHVQEPAVLDIQDSYGETTLTLACKNGNLRLVERLLSMGANPDIGNNYKETPVLIATQLGMKEILKELLEKGANPNKGARPPLHVAAASDSPDIVRLLLSHGADPTKQDEQGVMAFEIAELRNLADLAKRLNPQQFSLRTTREIFKLTIKSLASVKSHISLGPLFLNPETKSGWLQSILQKIQVR